MTGADLQEIEPERRASVALDIIETSHRQWNQEHRRPRALTAREGLAASRFEALFVWTAASNVRNGVVLKDADFERLSTACRWIDMICDEVL